MRIDLNLANTNSVESSPSTKNNGAKSHEVAGSAATQDATQLSAGVQRVSALESQLAQVPEVRSERVAQLQDAIRNGNYSVTNDQIASAMLSDSLSGRVRF
jgi:flagellar biosynthesis anti-sigma factor FlgM